MSKQQPVRGKKDSVVDELAALKEQWANVEEPASIDVPDGRYVAKIKEVAINKSKSSGRLQTSWQFVIAEGDYKGRFLFKHDGMDDDIGLGYLRAGLARLGVEWPDDPSELPEILDSLTETHCEVRVRTKEGSDFTNTYFIKGLPDYEAAEEEETEEVEETEEAEAVETPTIEVGMNVTAEYDDTPYPGKVVEVDEGEETATVDFEDGTQDTLAWSELTVVKGKGKAKTKKAEPVEEEEVEEVEEEEEEAPSWTVGKVCSVEIDGEDYQGKITKIKGDQATVKFDDGDIQTVSVDELKAAEETEEAEAEEETEETETEEVTGVEVSFDDDAITPLLKKKFEKLAAGLELESDEYNSTMDLAVDVAELADVTGEFSSPIKLLKAIEAAVAE